MIQLIWDDKDDETFGGTSVEHVMNATSSSVPDLNASQGNHTIASEGNSDLLDTSGSSSFDVVQDNPKPMMINCLLSCNDQTVYDEQEVSLVYVMAILKKIEITATKILYEIEDQSGSAVAYKMVKDSKGDENIKTKRYYKIFGRIDNSKDVGHLSVIKIFPVDNYGELLTFRLGLLNRLLSFENRRDGIDQDEKRDKKDIILSNEQYLSNGLDSDQMKIYKFIRECGHESGGVHHNDITNRYSHLTKSKLHSILDLLNKEGHIYYKIGNYYKAT